MRLGDKFASLAQLNSNHALLRTTRSDEHRRSGGRWRVGMDAGAGRSYGDSMQLCGSASLGARRKRASEPAQASRGDRWRRSRRVMSSPWEERGLYTPRKRR